ncbi:MAG: hypothetical protein Q4A11_05975 [Brachymonas sp.]|nr:hypothetical protein [Brachymonas sp.]
MRFFEHQTRARRGTARLLVLYALAVLLTVGLLVWVCSWFFPRDADRLRYALVTAVPFAAVILGASLYRLRQLSEGGGPAVALSLGGQLLQDGPTATLAERRALNVVEEMALAAADAAYRANPQPSPTQQALWQTLRAYLHEAEHLELASDDDDAGSATVMWQPS